MVYSKSDFLDWDQDLDLDSLLGDYTQDELQSSSGDDEVKCTPKVKGVKSKANVSNKIYNCDRCDKSYSSISGIRGHMRAKHGVQNVKVPLKGINVKASIAGTVVEVESSLTYMNEEDAPIEATFTFPVDDRSAVYRFEAEIQGRKIVAEIQEKEQAKLTYEDSKKEGKTAALLKQDDKSADIFQCMLGNLPPHAEATLRLVYVIELPQEVDGALRFTLPTILNPRYSPDAGSTVPAEGASYVPPCKIPYDFAFAAKVKGYHKVSSVKSDGSQLKIEMEENNQVAMVSLEEEFKFDRDLSFLVEYENCFNPQVVMEIGKPEEAGLFKEDMLMLSFRPDLKEVAMATSGEYIFVIDRSGSMQEDKIANAKEALLLFLKSLPADCYFNVVSFGSSFKTLFSSGSKKYSEASLNDALKLQKKMDADMGGTEIFRPLENVYKQKAIEGHQRNMFILTDGEVGNTDEIIALVKKHAGTVRVFALGIGHGASTSLVSGIARAGNGKAEFIADNSRVQPKVISLLKCSMQPACTNVEVSWDLPPGVTPMLIPQEMPPIVTAGERMTLYALMQNVDSNTIYGQSSVTLKGQLQGQVVSYTLPFTLNDENMSFLTTMPAHRLASKVQIKLLEDKEAAKMEEMIGGYHWRTEDNTAELREKIISLSRHANIVSKFTAFVAVDKEGEKVEGTMVQRDCPVPTLSPEFLEAQNRYGMMDCCMLRCSAPMAAPSGAPMGMMDCNLMMSRSAPMAAPQGADMGLRDYPLVGYSDPIASPQRDNLRSAGFSSPKGMKKMCLRDYPLVGYSDPIASPQRDNGASFSFSGLFGCASKSKNKKRKSRSSAPETTEASRSAPVASEDIDMAMDDDDCDEYEALCDEMESSNPIDTAADLTDDKRMMAVIAEQKLQGNWELGDTLAALLKLSTEQIRSAVPVKNDSVACTVVVVAWLQKKFASHKEEWQIIETKALAWLSGQSLGDKAVSDLLTDCTKCLWP